MAYRIAPHVHPVAFLMLLCADCSSDGDTTTISQRFEALSTTRFQAHLSGDAETPPVATTATGQALLDARSEAALSFKLIVANIDDVRAAHIHCAEEGESGPIGVTLFSGGPVSPNGILSEGTITAPDTGNDCGWDDLMDVIDAILSGGAYVNVHTAAHTTGEIRGQLK